MSEQTQNCGCWFEIAVSDLEASKAFYASVLQTELSIDTSGPATWVHA